MANIIRCALGKIKRRAKMYVQRYYDRFPFLIKSQPKGEKRAVHISAFSYGNAGDTLLPVVLRDLFNDTIGIKQWRSVDLHVEVRKSDVRFYNKKDFVVIGGGGLFLKDTGANDNSGWQWNCSIDNLAKINKPIIAFAIGYNRFRGQDDFEPIFTQHFNRFVEQVKFIGIRNHGSIEKLKKYLNSDALKNKLVYQPCMTTLISKIYPHLYNYRAKDNCVAFNCAFDRAQLRSSSDQYLHAIAKVAKSLSEKTKIRFYSHVHSDTLALKYFDEYKVDYEPVEFKNVGQIVECYSQPRLVIGMRGHAQMIPFGCGTPILSIISHDKMQWFLDDIHHPEWGCDVLDSDFENQLMQKSHSLFDNYEQCIDDIEEAKKMLWSVTLENMAKIKDILK